MTSILGLLQLLALGLTLAHWPASARAGNCGGIVVVEHKPHGLFVATGEYNYAFVKAVEHEGHQKHGHHQHQHQEHHEHHHQHGQKHGHEGHEHGKEAHKHEHGNEEHKHEHQHENEHSKNKRDTHQHDSSHKDNHHQHQKHHERLPGWNSISVNDNNVFVVRDGQSSLSGTLNGLNSSTRDTLRNLRSEFIECLDSMALSEGTRAGYSNSYQAAPSMAQNAVLALKGKQHSAGYGIASQAPSYAGPGHQVLPNGASYGPVYQPPKLAYNYYNLHASALNQTLRGDVYCFDLRASIVLDVYSTSVSVRQVSNGESILYRDHRYFSYARPQMGLYVNRMFLYGDTVFFVYNDGSVLAKASHMLDGAELELVVELRRHVKELSKQQGSTLDNDSSSGLAQGPNGASGHHHATGSSSTDEDSGEQ